MGGIMRLTENERNVLRQEIFTKVVTHLRNQKYKSKQPKSVCSLTNFGALRGLRNRKSAIGILIADEKYEKPMEFLTLYDLAKEYPNRVPSYFSDFLMRQFLWEINELHSMLLDTANKRQKWKKNFERKVLYLSWKYVLKIPKKVENPLDKTTTEEA
jgi:hypothetical protein